LKRNQSIAFIGLVAGASALVLATSSIAQVKSADQLLAATDLNGDGKIQRTEYVQWCAHKGGVDFDKWSNGAASMTPSDAFENYNKLLSYAD
jgi:hypothetical protein